MLQSADGPNLSHNFELEDAPDYLVQFPVLRGKAQLGRGEYSVVFEGCRLKGCDGIVEFIEYHGYMHSEEHQNGVHLVELRRLQPIDVATHTNLYWERESVMAAVRHRNMESDRFEGIIPAQDRYAGALQELSTSNLFSAAISKALAWIAAFMKSSSIDLLHDLCNPENYMTDGTRLIITDPLVTVPAD